MFGSLIAFAGCWHSDVQAAHRTIRHMAERGVKVIIHTGDFAYSNKGTFGGADNFLHKVNRELIKQDMFIIAIRGNHDEPDLYRKFDGNPVDGLPFTQMRERIFHAPDGTVWEYNGVKFLFLGGAFSVDRAFRIEGKSFWLDEVTDADALARSMMLPEQSIDIMVTHDVPAGIHLGFVDRARTPLAWDIPGAEMHRQPLGDVMKRVLKEGGFSIAGHMHARQDEQFRVAPDGRYINSVILDRGDATGKTAVTNSTIVLKVEDGRTTEVVL